jgi:type III restriction enzyme
MPRSATIRDLKRQVEHVAELPLAAALKDEVAGWSQQGWPGVTVTTRSLLVHWFNREEEVGDRFHQCQQRAIETVIYCHEILREPDLTSLYTKLAPQTIRDHSNIRDDVASLPFERYCLKMATGSGKTWVLIALLVWQYFNALRGENPGRFSYRFLIVVPGQEVLDRLSDAFRGRRILGTDRRDPATADVQRDLFIPPTPGWRGQFHLEALGPDDVRPNRAPPEGPFFVLTNWQQFRLPRRRASFLDRALGGDLEDLTKGELLAYLLTQHADLVVMNDEAHHVHSKLSVTGDELVWRRFLKVLHSEMQRIHETEAGTFLQLDFSATPFFGTGEKRDYFPHIIYDFSLLDAMREMLVKQLFLEEREGMAAERAKELDFRAERSDSPKGKRGTVTGLSMGQKILIDIGRAKLEQLASDFKQRGINRKPVMMILTEETDVVGPVQDYLASKVDAGGNPYDATRVLAVHSELGDADLSKARQRLDAIDRDDDPLCVVISVLMLREGFDKTNICVSVVLRATEADLLLEQIVGRGVRLMFPQAAYPELIEPKREAVLALQKHQRPENSLDFLFVVEHPKFRAFYQALREAGYTIGGGDTTTIAPAGDLETVPLDSARIGDLDIAWPMQIYSEGRGIDFDKIEPSRFAAYPALSFDALQKLVQGISIQDVHAETGTKVKAWKLDNRYFDYGFFLRQAAGAIARSGTPTPLLTAELARVSAVIDEYVGTYLFRQPIDFTQRENYTVLNYTEVFEHVVRIVRNALVEAMDQGRYEVRRGEWRRLSDVPEILLRRSKSLKTDKCIYPRQGYQAMGGGLERWFMANVLEVSAEVTAFAKLDKKHNLVIAWRDLDGVLRKYEVDFIVRSHEGVFIVETKGDRDLDSPGVALKARAASGWSANASDLEVPDGLKQPRHFEYLLVAESTIESNPGMGFDALLAHGRAMRDRVVSRAEERLFSR